MRALLERERTNRTWELSNGVSNVNRDSRELSYFMDY